MRELILSVFILFGLIACGPVVTGETANAAEPTPHIVVDQFGYLPELEKRAVLRNPKRGYDAGQNYTPASRMQLINTATGQAVFEAAPRAWQGGATDSQSGDQAWVFDFSSVTQRGRYVVRDPQNRLDSYPFEINANVYKPVLKAAFKSLYYQRAGFAKQAPYAAAGFEDRASHLGAGQDSQTRNFFDKGNVASARDLRGGWYDAGDYNKYTNWTANYILSLLHSYEENPRVWGDDFGIPESGNGVPDILDEVKWGLDWLARMQNPDGSLLSIQGLASASPPSAASGPSYYGPPSTSASLSGAAAFGYAAKVFKGQDSRNYGSRAVRAWGWASKNPRVIFRNNEGRSKGLGAGQQEVDSKGLQQKWLQAAVYLHTLTGEPVYGERASQLYRSLKPIDPYWFNSFESQLTQTLVFYAKQPRTDRALKAKILSDFKSHVFESEPGMESIRTNDDPYGSPLKTYTWGSNSIKAGKGALFMAAVWSSLFVQYARARRRE